MTPLKDAFLSSLVEKVKLAQELIPLIRRDGFVNTVTGLGTSKDKSTYNTISPTRLLQPVECEILFREDIPSKIVNKVVEEGTREGFSILIDEESDKKLETKIFDRRQELLLEEKETEAWTQGRLSGWGALYLITDDGLLPEEPLDVNRVTKILGAQVWERMDVSSVARYYDDPTNPKHGKPEVYVIQPRASMTGTDGQVSVGLTEQRKIHESRLVIFEGPYTPKQTKLENLGFNMSVLQRPNQEVINFGATWGALNNLITDASQSIYSMQGLQAAIAAGQSASIISRLSLMEQTRSFMRAIVVDADKEKFERHQTQLTGYADVLEMFMSRIAAAAEMPVTVLFGISPAGMNATGESDRGIWEDTVKGQQSKVYKPALEKITKLILREQGKGETTFKIEFKPLRQASQTETATIRKTVADTDKVYFDIGAVTAEEIGLSRFGSRGWSMETNIDLDLRKKIQAEDVEENLRGPDPVDPNVTPEDKAPPEDAEA